MVGIDGLEPSTSRLSGVRSNHLRYTPTLFGILLYQKYYIIANVIIGITKGLFFLSPIIRHRLSKYERQTTNGERQEGLNLQN